jgi:hypothetical protein
MRKKIIVVIGIMLLSIMMFGCRSNSDLKIPKNLELKEFYTNPTYDPAINSMGDDYIRSLNICTLAAIELYKKMDLQKKDDITIDDSFNFNDLVGNVDKIKYQRDLLKNEKELLINLNNISSNIGTYSTASNRNLDTKKEESNNLKKSIKRLLDCYSEDK